MSKKHTVYYPCMELLGESIAGRLTAPMLTDQRKDLKDAKTVAVVIHGKPGRAGEGFNTANVAICDPAQLAALIVEMLPPRGEPYNIALIMCYGARSQNAGLDHSSSPFAQADLATSFAYRFFRSVCPHRHIRMTARTGAVSNDAVAEHTVETEAQVFKVLLTATKRTIRAANAATMQTRKDDLIARGRFTQEQLIAQVMRFGNDPNLLPDDTSEVEVFAHEYVLYSPMFTTWIDRHFAAENLGNRSKIGKFIFEFIGGQLVITSRFGATRHELYRGALI